LTIRNSKLTRTHRLHVDGSCDSSMQHCPPSSAFASFDASARLRRDSAFQRSSNVVVGKNYRLQNIQLSKISLGALPPNPRLGRSRGPKPPLRSLAGARSHVQANLLTSAADRTRGRS
jgi:hypothetical protein